MIIIAAQCGKKHIISVRSVHIRRHITDIPSHLAPNISNKLHLCLLYPWCIFRLWHNSQGHNTSTKVLLQNPGMQNSVELSTLRIVSSRLDNSPLYTQNIPHCSCSPNKIGSSQQCTRNTCPCCWYSTHPRTIRTPAHWSNSCNFCSVQLCRPGTLSRC